MIADAFDLRGRKGSDLLSQMGRFSLWHGDLAEMRGDSPVQTGADVDDRTDAERFLQTFAVSEALDDLPPKCEALMRLVYCKNADVEHAGHEDPPARYAETCLHSLLEAAGTLYRDLVQLSERDNHPSIHLSASA